MQQMQVKYRQRTKYGCGSFALANIFDDHRFLDTITPTQGDRIVDLNRKMEQFHPELYIDPMFITSPNFNSGHRLTYAQARDIFLSIDDVDIIPLLLTFARETNEMHMVATLYSSQEGLIYVADSCSNEVKSYMIDELVSEYPIVAIHKFGIWDCHDNANMLMIPKGEFSHILG